MSELTASGFTGVFTVRIFSDPDLYAFAGRLAGLGYSVAQIRISGTSGYIYLPLEGGSFAKKNFAEIYYQPRSFTVVSEDFGNFQLSSGELVRAIKESGTSGLDYAELTVNFERTISLPKISMDSWDFRGIIMSRNKVNSKSYEQISVSRINDELSRYAITLYLRDEYEIVANVISQLRSKMDESRDIVEKYILWLFKPEKNNILGD
ncbi:hypothetical protein [Acidianus sp. RZ1]|uniref:hypothetical protein n=1 Tax=Acidianus sp. RZ1 TaxID=1540082 RepID=UPI00149242FD|nr:hypothetical protein [Acidianus sp. RZ1]NON63522.1 hypothetical protein [Acidianus sp. RZ1]